jgi:hypothetical protein
VKPLPSPNPPQNPTHNPLGRGRVLGIDKNTLKFGEKWGLAVTRVNSTNVLNEGLGIGEIGRRMNSKVKLVEIGVYRK